MDRKKYFIIALLAASAAAAVVYFLFFFPVKPREWTPQNALHPSSAPTVQDTREVDSLVRAIDNSLDYFERREKAQKAEKTEKTGKVVFFGRDQVPTSLLKESLLDFKSKLLATGLSPGFFRYVRENYRFYQSAAREEVLFTGYYEADLKGSLTPSEVYCWPLYRKPADLYRVELSAFPFFSKFKGLPPILRGRLSPDVYGNAVIVPYYTREEIDFQQKLLGKGLEIVWIDDPLEIFFLHIQGSGIVELDSGKNLRVNYDESNGHPYVAIGRVMVQQGLLSPGNVSMQSIRDYLEKHPEKVKEILITNPSYVFFREVKEGPLGSLGVPVTAYRSIATDRFLFPKGALVYIETQLPVFDERGNLKGSKAYSGFVLNQDTGGAIRGPGRVDFFTGYGKDSRLIAGHLKQKGAFYFLIKR